MIAAIEHANRMVAICAKHSSTRKEQLAALWMDRCAHTFVVARLEAKSGAAPAQQLREHSQIATIADAAAFLDELRAMMNDAAHDAELSMLLKMVDIADKPSAIDDALKAVALFTVTLAILGGAGDDEAGAQVLEAKDPGPQ